MTDLRESVGERFSLAAMRHSRNLAMEAVRRIAAQIRPGMTEQQARDAGGQILAELGMQRIWHRTIVRFGEDTLKTFTAPPDPARTLREHDIFFVDIGPVWNGHEGDAGDTFVVGNDSGMHACAQAVRTLWRKVRDRWQADRLSGSDLYDYAAEQARLSGWRLNLEIRGHRICDFPHAIYRAGDLGDFGLCPSAGLWVLEIQIAHPTRSFGAFYEDMLVESAERVHPAPGSHC